MMEHGFKRKDGSFSLCGLNCGLCPMKIRGSCSGCFTDSPCYPTCPIAPCSVRHGNVEYCYQCEEYPCSRYDGIDEHDSLISHRNQKKDLAKAKTIGIEAYLREQHTKQEILGHLLRMYDDGNRDVFFCQAVNRLPLSELEDLMESMGEEDVRTMGITDRAGMMQEELQKRADKLDIDLKLRR